VAGYSQTAQAPDVVVVGGGIIGLAVAFRARQAGLSVHVLESGPVGAQASRVAAGMLAPVTEIELGEGGRGGLELGLRSAAMWPGFAAELEAAGEMEVGFEKAGTLMVARDDDEARELERQLELRQSLGVRAVRLRPSQAREREGALAPTVRMALEAPDDHSVDPRLVVGALRKACERAGVLLNERTPVRALRYEKSGRRVAGVIVADGGARLARRVVVATGAWSGALDFIPEHTRVPVRPVKGQVIYLRDRAGAGLLRGAVRCAGAYLVPRADGRLALGATVEERGFDLQPTAGAAYELLRGARELVPGTSELDLEEVCVGLRPGTPDNRPIIGPAALEGLVWATGHYRNGILLAPLTAKLVTDILCERRADPLLSLCDPAREALRHAAGASRDAGPLPARSPVLPFPQAPAGLGARDPGGPPLRDRIPERETLASLASPLRQAGAGAADRTEAGA
jgi:glycine oxidase